MRVLVTGGGGFIGSHIVDRFLEEGYAVRVLDNFSTGRRSNLAGSVDGIEVVEGDIRSYERVHNAVRGCEVVLHQAALPSVPRSIQDPLTSHAVNIDGTLNVLLAARDAGTRRVVYASSSSIYGPTAVLPKHEAMVPQPVSPYAVTKLAAESYCRSFRSVYGLETVALRYFNVFGARQDPRSQYAAVVPNFISAILADRPPSIFGDGEQTRDFTHVDNVVAANLLAVKADRVGSDVYNVACGDRVSLNTLAELLGDILDRDVCPEYLPARPGDVRDSLADIDLVSRELGYSVLIPLREGLLKTIEHFSTEASHVG